MHEGRCLILNEKKEGDKVVKISLSRPQDLHGLYAPYIYQDEETKQSYPISKLWFKWNKRRVYREGFWFAPGKNSTRDAYNLWYGLSVNPKPGKWDSYQDHLYEVIANGNQDIYTWLIHWMARIVQDPAGERPGTCVTLRGPQGTGKGTFATIFGKLFGDHHFYPISNEKHITGQFNRHLATSVLVFLDEAIWEKRLKAAAGMLKAMISEPRLTVEEKFHTPFTIPNYINVIIAGNNEWLVPAGMQERRFCVLDISSKKQNNYPYFEGIYNQMMKGNGLSAMLYDLLQVDLSQVNLRMIPKTAALFDQIRHNFDSIQSFWFESFNNAYIRSTRLKSMFSVDLTKASEVPKEGIYKVYVEHCQDRKIRPVDAATFWKNSKKTVPIDETRPRQNDAQRPRYCWLPGIQKCREQFEQATGQKIEWSG